jgi:hypothetical protein
MLRRRLPSRHLAVIGEQTPTEYPLASDHPLGCAKAAFSSERNRMKNPEVALIHPAQRLILRECR